MNITKYLILGLTLTISGVACGAEADKKREAAITKAHSLATHEELDAAEKDGLLACPLVIDVAEGRGTHTISLACSVARNPKADPGVLNACISKANASSIGVIIKMGQNTRELSLLCDLFMRGNIVDVKEKDLNDLLQLRNKCKEIVALTGSPLSCTGTQKGSVVPNFVAISAPILARTYQMHDDDSAEYPYHQEMFKRHIKYSLTMVKAVHEACEERYQGLPKELADGLHMFSMDLVKLVQEYIVTREELAEAAKLKLLLAHPKALLFLKEFEKESEQGLPA